MLATSATLRTELHQTVNPHLIIVGALLQLSNAELELMIREELERNPALEVDLADEPSQTADPADHLSWECEAAGLYDWWRAPATAAHTAEDFDPLQQVPAGTTLREYLLHQFRAAAPKSLHRAGEYLIENINSDGYLECELSEAADALQIPLYQVEEALKALQELEPPGVAARSLRESLLLQLRYLDIEAPPGLGEVIEACTGDSPLRIADVARRARLSVHQTQVCLEFIRSHFAPYPGRSVRTCWGEVVSDRQPTISPDALITLENGQIIVRVPESPTFRLRLNDAYRRLMEALEAENTYARCRHRSAELARAHEQAAECVRRARSLIQQVQQRNRTIWQVTNAIATRQKAFLLHGPDYLLPLTKKQIAQALGIHESIVCRATRGKHVMLPSGKVVSFDVFFDDALPVKHFVQGLIAAESPTAPLSDADIARALASSGIAIARRTVTKYRRALRIPPSRDRACVAA